MPDEVAWFANQWVWATSLAKSMRGPLSICRAMTAGMDLLDSEGRSTSLALRSELDFRNDVVVLMATMAVHLETTSGDSGK